METLTEKLPFRAFQSLAELGRAEGLSPSIAIGAAYYCLRQRYSIDEDSPGGELPADFHPDRAMLGDAFANPDLSRQSTFRMLLKQLRARALEPGQEVLEGHAGSETLFHIHLTPGDTPRRTFRFPAVDLRWSNAPNPSRSDFNLWLRATQDEFLCTVEYSTDAFEVETIRRFIGHLRTFFGGIGAKPDLEISQLPLLPEAERKQLVEIWNGTQRDYPREFCLHQLVELQAEKTPEAPALVFESQTLTYRELNERANQLAHHLRKLGVGPDLLVAICIERSLEMIIALLGILKAGGAYIPLDPDNPRERLAVVIEDAAPVALLTQERWLPALPPTRVPVLCLDRDGPTLSAEPITNPESAVTPLDQVYVIFTSGSTGKPKGVSNVHQGIVNHLFWMQHAIPMDCGDRIIQKTPYTFDVSVWEIFWPLMAGACLVIARPQGHKDMNYLIDLIVRQRITNIHFVPAMLRIFLKTASVERSTSLRRVHCSGEALPFDLAKETIERLKVEVHDLYGPTEASVHVTHWQPNADDPRQIVPIGRPIGNTQMYVLDKRLNPMPIGVSGELHIGGRGVARGYLNRPELTAEKFIPDPFTDTPGAHLYKTGDLARFLPDGAIEYLGRIDTQLKLRGFRIEPGEIEKALEGDADVRQSVVVALDDPSGEKRLVAYVVPRQKPGAGRDDQVAFSRELVARLRQFLQNKLPDSMVPSLFVLVETIPLTSSGKVDRRALPAPDWARPEGQSEYVEPQNAIEKTVAEIFADVLQIERVGRDDNFFEIGGHSLAAAQVATQLAQLLGLEVPLRAVLEWPTVGALAQALATLQPSEPVVELPAIVPVAKRHGIPLSIAQEALWYEYQIDPNSPVYNVPLLSRLRGNLDRTALEKAFLALVERHELLRTAILSSGGLPVLFPLKTGRGGWQQADLRHLKPDERDTEAQQLVNKEAARPFDLARDPLLRCLLIRLTDDEWIFLHNSPHIVLDGGSLQVFYRELSQLYNRVVEGRSTDLPALPFQFADFAAWQRRVLQGEYLNSLSQYWKKQLAGTSPIDLPTDFARPPVHRYHGTHRFFAIDPELLARATAFFRAAGSTSFRGMYAAFNVLLYCYSGLEDLCIGSPTAPINRACQGIENLIGFFVNTVCLRTNLGGDPTFQEVLRRAELVVEGAMGHCDLPFAKVVEALQLKRDPSRPVLFQINFRASNQLFPALEMNGIAADPAKFVDTGTSKFDLALEIDTAGGKNCHFEYRTDLFREETIRQMGQDFEDLLRGLIARPEIPIRQVPQVAEISGRMRKSKAGFSYA